MIGYKYILDDHSRVVLLESKKGDYINANYIKVRSFFTVKGVLVFHS